MRKNKKIVNEKNQIVKKFNKIEMHVIPYLGYGYVISNKEATEGYGVGESNIRKHKHIHKDDLVENKHYIIVTNSNTLSKTDSRGRGIT